MGFSNLFHYNSAALECVTCFLTVSRIQTSFVVQSSLSSLEFYVGSPCLLAYHNELNNSMWTLKYVQAQFILSPKTQLRASSRFYHWLWKFRESMKENNNCRRTYLSDIRTTREQHALVRLQVMYQIHRYQNLF